MIRRVLLVAVIVAVVAAGGRAGAHDPLFLTPEQTTPETGPLLPDGTISFAIYGDLAGGDDARGMQVAFEEGDRLLVEVLIPALPPEADLAEDQLPVATVVAPDGTETVLVPTQRSRFDEPFSSTSYYRLARLDGEAQEGLYDIVVTGAAPARFTIAVGTTETFLTPVERVENRATSFDGFDAPLADWYAGVGTTIEAPAPPAVAEAPTAEPTAAPALAEEPGPTRRPSPQPTSEQLAAPVAPSGGGDGSPWMWILIGSAVLAVVAVGGTWAVRR